MLNKKLKLSDLYGKENELTESEINNIIFDEIKEEQTTCKYAIVFGSPDFQKYRIKRAIELYKEKRIQKLILTGGIGRETEISKRNETEAMQMKKIASKNGVSAEDIIVEDESTTTIENCINVSNILGKEKENLEDIILVSSEWHLKRCLAIAMKYISTNIKYSYALVKDGIADKENWEKSEQGRYLVKKEINILAEHANQGLIYNLEIKDKIDTKI